MLKLRSFRDMARSRVRESRRILPQLRGSTSLTIPTAQLHSVPPYAAAWVWSNLIAYFSDKTRHRSGFILLCVAIAIAGFGMLLGIHKNLHAEYAALFLAVTGTYSALPIIVCWVQMNLGEMLLSLCHVVQCLANRKLSISWTSPQVCPAIMIQLEAFL